MSDDERPLSEAAIDAAGLEPEEREELELAPRSDGSPRRAAPVLSAMRALGPATAAEIAARLDRKASNVSTQLRQYEERGEVHRTGRSVNEPGARGGPAIEWALGPAPNGQPTGPETQVQMPPGSLEVERERVRTLSERVARLSENLERAEDERDAAREALERASLERDEAVEARRVAEESFDELETRLQDVERQRDEAVAELQPAFEDAESLMADRNLSQSELDDIAELLGVEKDAPHGILRTKVAELLGSADIRRVRRLQQALMELADELWADFTIDEVLENVSELATMIAECRGSAARLDEARATEARLRDQIALAGAGGDPFVAQNGRTDMRRAYFDALMAQVQHGQAGEEVYDRIERLIDGGGHGE